MPHRPHLLCLAALCCLALSACKSTPTDESATPANPEPAAADASAAPSALAQKLRGPAPKARPDAEALALAHGENRWDEWAQLPLALDLDKSQRKAWGELTDAWGKRKAAGEDMVALRSQLLGNLSAEQQQYWVRYVLYRDAAWRVRQADLTDTQFDKLWAAAAKPAQKLYADGVLTTNPYMKGLGETIDQVIAAVE